MFRIRLPVVLLWWTKTNAQKVQEPAGSPKFFTFLSTHAPLFVDPGSPSEHLPNRILCVGFWAVKTIAACSAMLCIATPISGLYQVFRECGLPCGLRGSLCTLQLITMMWLLTYGLVSCIFYS